MKNRIKKFWIDAVVCGAAIAGYVIAAEAELFEGIYAFSRAHEDWDLDELILIYAIAALALPILLLRSKARLKRAVEAVAAAEQTAQHAARHDALTGLFNRRHFYRLLQESISCVTPTTHPVVLLLDLDRFKAINDLRGHAAGDRVLREVSRRVLACCQDGAQAARLGGDEFAILLTDTNDFEAATRLARRLLTSIQEPFHMDGWYASVGTSIGICGWSEGDDDTTVVRNADQAMYKAKADGRNRYAFYNKDLGDALKRQALLEEELKQAVQKMTIAPYFQPIIDITSGDVRGFEVLSRWTSPTVGPVSPELFIAMAEDMGLIDAITWQIMRKALKIAKDWDSELFIAFNMSPQLFNDELVQNVKWCLSEAAFDPQRMEIEITENAVIDNMEEAKHSLDALKGLGVRIALDDFGTGFSSLATLSKLPFDKIKIDKSFVTALHSTSQNAKIVGAILALAKSLEINVTAEGIETREELGFLTARECRLGQGYLFSKPIAADAVAQFLSDHAGDARSAG